MFLRVATEGPKMLGEVMPFREIGAKIGIVKRVHIRSRSFSGGGEDIDLDNTMRTGK